MSNDIYSQEQIDCWLDENEITQEDLEDFRTDLAHSDGLIFDGLYDVANYCMHYGMPRRSGRYPWGSGEDPNQRTEDFAARVDRMRRSGMSDTEICSELGILNDKGIPSSTKLRAQYSMALEDRQLLTFARMKSLKEDGLNRSEIARAMGVNESTVRGWEKQLESGRVEQARKTAEFLKDQVKEKGLIDVGKGTATQLGISDQKLNEALYMLEEEGYVVAKGSVPQATMPNQKTNIKVLGPAGTPKSAAYSYGDIKSVDDSISYDYGDTFQKAFQYPASLDSKRLQVLYEQNGGSLKDGLIEVRRGVKDLDLGSSNYCQVRIMVDDNYYLKGMACYADDLPEGVDVRFNSNKDMNKGPLKALKEIKRNPDGSINRDNPFGALIKEKGGQSMYTGDDGEQHLSLINKTREEGDWEDWDRKLPSQFLAKQNKSMIERQLNLTIAEMQADYDDRVALENPVVKRKMLQNFADACDKRAVHLDAAALPRQGYNVILPCNTLKDGECFAPGYKDGEELALVRFPHGGTFEIPIVTVNNKNQEGISRIGLDSPDGIGINKHTASILSGADFDGDTVMAIPTKSKARKNAEGVVAVTATKTLKGLDGFDPSMAYPERPGMTYMKYIRKDGKEIDNTQKQMGEISNLIMDMTLEGATESELARAVRHSMVIIDAGKHKLDYKRSEVENGIAELKKKYQYEYDEDGNKIQGGAATLITRAKSQAQIDKRRGSPSIDPETGDLIYKPAFDLYYTERKVNKRTGEVTETIKTRHEKSTKMAEAKDARELISKYNTIQEQLYADYANKLKDMARQARLEILATQNIPYSREAREKYKDEVDDLESQLKIVKLNAPKERMAQLQAADYVNKRVSEIEATGDEVSNKELKKMKQQALTNARLRTGAKRHPISISDRAWEAIQAGAFSTSKLTDIVNAADPDRLSELAMPKNYKTTITTAKQQKIENMKRSGYTLEEIAEAVGVSKGTVSKYLKG